MYEDFGCVCALSGEGGTISIDHVIPRQPGKKGRSSQGNLLPIAHRLNSSKSNRNFFEWFKDNHARLGLCVERFEDAIEYLALQNKMSVSEYYEYYQREYLEYATYKEGEKLAAG